MLHKTITLQWLLFYTFSPWCALWKSPYTLLHVSAARAFSSWDSASSLSTSPSSVPFLPSSSAPCAWSINIQTHLWHAVSFPFLKLPVTLPLGLLVISVTISIFLIAVLLQPFQKLGQFLLILKLSFLHLSRAPLVSSGYALHSFFLFFNYLLIYLITPLCWDFFHEQCIC